MPRPLFGRSAVFSVEGVGENRFSVAFSQVHLVEGFYILEQVFEFGDDTFGQDGETVVVAFSAANDDLAVVEINVLNAQAQTFQDRSPAPYISFAMRRGAPRI